MFYGLQFPTSEDGDGDQQTCEQPVPTVLTSREEVFKLLKVHKKARFKCFPNEEEAKRFAENKDAKEKVEQDGDDNDDGGEEEKKGKKKADEGCPFSGLTAQQLKQLKEAIAKKEIARIDQLSKYL